MRKIIAIGILFAFVVAFADTGQKNLQRLQKQIQSLKSNLRREQSTRSNLRTYLQKSETQIGKLNYQLHQTKTQLQQQQTVVDQLNHQQQQYETSLKQQQQILAQQIRAAYILDHQQYIQALLNQQDPAQVSRMLTYYHYLMNSRADIINKINITLQQLATNKRAIANNALQLQNLQHKQQNQQTTLLSAKNSREQLLQTINTEIQGKNQRLTELLANKQALERVVKRLTFNRSAAFRLPPGKLFSQLRGRLPWPTVGRIIEGYNTQIEQSQLKLNGVIISAPEGQNIYAVAPGHVVFSDWMPGYGLLLIIDHGQGYMTLYGRNDALFKKTGENVSAGELIATVGHSGGYTNPGLYFAIRQDAMPVNPAQWCR